MYVYKVIVELNRGSQTSVLSYLFISYNFLIFCFTFMHLISKYNIYYYVCNTLLSFIFVYLFKINNY